jgi:hypothetical protein
VGRDGGATGGGSEMGTNRAESWEEVDSRGRIARGERAAGVPVLLLEGRALAELRLLAGRVVLLLGPSVRFRDLKDRMGDMGSSSSCSSLTAWRMVDGIGAVAGRRSGAPPSYAPTTSALLSSNDPPCLKVEAPEIVVCSAKKPSSSGETDVDANAALRPVRVGEERDWSRAFATVGVLTPDSDAPVEARRVDMVRRGMVTGKDEVAEAWSEEGSSGWRPVSGTNGLAAAGSLERVRGGMGTEAMLSAGRRTGALAAGDRRDAAALALQLVPRPTTGERWL